MNSKGTRAVIGSSILFAAWLNFPHGVDWTPLAVGTGIGVLSWASSLFALICPVGQHALPVFFLEILRPRSQNEVGR